jgi:tetratricopeptide (TPR) repeat protein
MAGTDAGSRPFVELILDQTEEQDPDLAALLRACAIPRRVDAATVAALRGEPDDEAGSQALMDRIARFSFVRPHSDGTVTYHDATREVLLEDWRRQDNRVLFKELNGRLLDHFRAEQAAAAQLDQHFARVAGVIRRANATRHAQVAAAVDARLVTAVIEVLYHETLNEPSNAIQPLQRWFYEYERKGRLLVCRALLDAERLWLESGLVVEHDPALRSWLRYYSARLLSATDRASDAIEILESLRAEAVTDPRLMSWVLTELAIAYQRLCQYQAARAVYMEGLAIVERTPEERFSLASIHGLLAGVHWATGDMAAARASYLSAIEAARRMGNPTEEVMCLANLAEVLGGTGDGDRALDYALEALDVARTDVPDDLMSQSLVGRAVMTLLTHSDPDLADAAFAEAEAMQRTSLDPRGEMEIRLLRAAEQARTGQLRRSAQGLERLHSRLEMAPAFEVGLLLAEADVAERSGRLDEAVQRYGEALARSEGRLEARADHALALVEAGWLQARLGLCEEGIANLDTGAAAWTEIGNPAEAALARLRIASVHRLRGAFDRAAELSAEAAGPIERSGWAALRGELEQELAAQASALGRWTDVTRHLERAAGAWIAARRPGKAAADLLLLASAAAVQGDAAEAAAYSVRAAGLFDRIAAVDRYEPSEPEREAARLNADGLRLFSAEDEVHEALTHFQAAQDRAPRKPLYGLNLAYASARLGDWAEASRTLRDVVKYGPGWVDGPVLRRRLLDWRALLGRQRAATGQARAALRDLRAVLHQVQANPEVACLPSTARELGDGFLQLGEVAAARAAYGAGMERPATGRSAFAEGALQARLGVVDALQGELVSAAKRLGDSLEASRRLGGEPAQDLARECSALMTSMPAFVSTREAWHQLVSERPGERWELYDVWLDVAGWNLPDLLRTVAGRPALESTQETAAVVRVGISLGTALTGDGADAPGVRWLTETGIPNLRARIYESRGVLVPPLTLLADPVLPPDGYRLQLDSTTAAQGSVAAPDAHEQVLLRIESLLLGGLDRFLGLRDLPGLLTMWAEGSAERTAMMERVLEDPGLLLRASEVLRALARERVPIADLGRPLGVLLAENAHGTDVWQLIEHARHAMRDVLPGADGTRRLIGLSTGFERVLAAATRRNGSGPALALPQAQLERLVSAVDHAVDGSDVRELGLVVESARLRPALRRLLEPDWSELAVLSRSELLRPDIELAERIAIPRRSGA